MTVHLIAGIVAWYVIVAFIGGIFLVRQDIKKLERWSSANADDMSQKIAEIMCAWVFSPVIVLAMAFYMLGNVFLVMAPQWVLKKYVTRQKNRELASKRVTVYHGDSFQVREDGNPVPYRKRLCESCQEREV